MSSLALGAVRGSVLRGDCGGFFVFCLIYVYNMRDGGARGRNLNDVRSGQAFTEM